MALTPEERRKRMLELPSLDEAETSAYEEMDQDRAVDTVPEIEIYSEDEADHDVESESKALPDRIYLREQERTRRRRVSSRKNRLLVGVISTFVLIAAASIVFVFLKIDSDNKGKAEAIASMEDAIHYVTQADEMIIALDEAVYAEVGSEEHELAVGLLQDTTETDVALDDAEQAARTALDLSGYLDDEERQVASALIGSIGGRREMVSVGRVLISTDAAASRARDKLDLSYEKLLEADKLIRDGAALAATVQQGDELNLESAEQVVEYDRRALEALQQADAAVKEASEEFDHMEISGLTTYIEKRIQAVSLLVSADTAVQNEEFEQAATEIEAYNLLDAEVVELAKALPSDSAAFVAEAYRTLTEVQREAYSTARESASSGDAIIRDYQERVGT